MAEGRELILLRHAKSSWEDPTLRDFDRPLNDRGRRDAPRIGEELRWLGLIPDLILCSTARRTLQTLEAVKQFAPSSDRTHRTDALYLAEADGVRAIIRDRAKSHRRVLVIGHNPGLEELALFLADPATSDQTALARLAEKFPTGAFAAFAVAETAWARLEDEQAQLKRFVRPRDLAP